MIMISFLPFNPATDCPNCWNLLAECKMYGCGNMMPLHGSPASLKSIAEYNKRMAAQASRTVTCATCDTVYQILQTGSDVHDDPRLCCPRCWRLEDGTPVWQRSKIRKIGGGI